MIPALIAPLLTQGLGLIANAVIARGKDWVEEKTGVKLDQQLSPEDQLKLKQFEIENELELKRIKLEERKLDLTELNTAGDIAKNDDFNISERWKFDMASDSVLSKNVRPGVLIYILTAFLLLALLDGAGYRISEAYVSLLGQWGMLVMTTYFGGRTVEKVIQLLKKDK